MLIEVCNWLKYNPRSDYKTMPWLRLESDIGQSKKLFSLGPDQKWLWIYLISKVAEEFTESNRTGTIEIDLEYLAFYSGVAPDRVASALEHFKKKGLIRIDGDPPPDSERDAFAPRTDHERDTNDSRTDDVREPNGSDRAAPDDVQYANANENDNSNTPLTPQEGGEGLGRVEPPPDPPPKKRQLRDMAKAAAVDVERELYRHLVRLTFGGRDFTDGWGKLARRAERALREKSEQPFLHGLRRDFAAKAEEAWIATGAREAVCG